MSARVSNQFVTYLGTTLGQQLLHLLVDFVLRPLLVLHVHELVALRIVARWLVKEVLRTLTRQLIRIFVVAAKLDGVRLTALSSENQVETFSRMSQRTSINSFIRSFTFRSIGSSSTNFLNFVRIALKAEAFCAFMFLRRSLLSKVSLIKSFSAHSSETKNFGSPCLSMTDFPFSNILMIRTQAIRETRRQTEAEMTYFHSL